MRKTLAATLLAAGLVLAGCGPDDKPAQRSETTGLPSPLAAAVPAPPSSAGDPGKGKQVWLGQCIACHNPDPARDGPVGPAVKGSSRELLETRVLRGEYPPGYKPKRETKIMPPRPDLVASIPDLAAYLH